MNDGLIKQSDVTYVCDVDCALSKTLSNFIFFSMSGLGIHKYYVVASSKSLYPVLWKLKPLACIKIGYYFEGYYRLAWSLTHTHTHTHMNAHTLIR